ncbi:hypothetical protein C1I36_12965 [Dehalobacter sp. 14DCB1]|nr:hypothetical protein C1I36_12965 [Dehalobacter sp. 14DCB1]
MAVGVRNVEHIVQAQPASAFVDEGNAFCAAVDPTAQFLIPYFDGCAGCCAVSLRVNQKLVLKRVFIVPGSRFQKGGPVDIVSCDAAGGCLR